MAQKGKKKNSSFLKIQTGYFFSAVQYIHNTPSRRNSVHLILFKDTYAVENQAICRIIQTFEAGVDPIVRLGGCYL